MSEKKEYIERRSALEEIDDLIRQTCNKPVPPLKVKRMIENLPAADVVEVVHGKWMTLEAECGLFGCSECEQMMLRANWKYCPNCGTKMDGEKAGV